MICSFCKSLVNLDILAFSGLALRLMFITKLLKFFDLYIVTTHIDYL